MSTWKDYDPSVSNPFICTEFDRSVIPTLEEYIRIPNQSPDFDKEWATNGLMEKAMNVLVEWVRAQNLSSTSIELIQDDGLTPFLLIDVSPMKIEGQTTFKRTNSKTSGQAAANSVEPTVLLYGHMDKQPPLAPELWDTGLGPYEPVIRDGRLYGRGGADDGYAVCSAVLAIKALQVAKISHGRFIIVIEASEESSESHLPFYIDAILPRIGKFVQLVVCLDSGALSYDRLWLTSSLRGMVAFDLSIQVATAGSHSGICGGIVPDPTRILRCLLDRLEDPVTGTFKLPEGQCQVPEDQLASIKGMDDVSADEFLAQYPLLNGVTPQSSGECPKNSMLAITNYWNTSMTIVGFDGLPPSAVAGNVINPCITAKVSIRTPPSVKSEALFAAIERTLTSNIPHNAKVALSNKDGCDGWFSKKPSVWLEKSLATASSESFDNKSWSTIGIGGTIPFIGDLALLFPEAQFVVTGVLGPKSNAHGPNEFLDLKFTKKVTCCVARILADWSKNMIE